MASNWTLPAPESQVLLTGPQTPRNWAIKLALKELVLRRVLSVRTVEVRRFWVLRRQVSILVDGTHRNDHVSRPLLAVLDVLPRPTAYPEGVSGVLVRDAAIEVMRWYQAAGGYIEAEVLPELRRQGLFDVYVDAGRSRWRLTRKGEEELARLRGLMETGRTSFAAWVERDLPRASEYVSMAGPAVLLLGNPVPWVWIVLMETLSGDEGLAMPWSDPFAEPLDRRGDDDGSGGHFDAGGRSRDDEPSGDTIDREVDAASDEAGDGDGGDGE